MKKLKTFTKTGLKNEKGEIIIPAKYTDIERIDKHLVSLNNNIIISSEQIFIAYQSPYYHIYTEYGEINCPFKIKYYYVKNGILVGLLDSDGYCHITCIDPSSGTIKILYENLSNIESANHNHVVCRQTNNNLFVFSLETQNIIIPPSYYKEIVLHSEGIIVKKEDFDEIYDYNGNIILSEKYKFSVIKGIKINSHELILAKSKDNLFGLFSFTGNCILECKYMTLIPNKHYYNNREYITIKIAPNFGNHSLLYLDSNLNTHLLYSSNYFRIGFFDCGRVGLIKQPKGRTDCLIDMTQMHNSICIKLLEAEQITPLYNTSCKHFIVWKKKKCGVCDLKGKLIIPIKYKSLKSDEWNTQVYATSFWGNSWLNL